jgi:hypothetical protein
MNENDEWLRQLNRSIVEALKEVGKTFCRTDVTF